VAAGLVGIVLSLLAIGVGWDAQPRPAAAAGSCGTTHDALTAEEGQLLGMISDWRIQNGIPNAVPLQASGPLVRAAAWYAEDMVAHGSFGGHVDSEGRYFNERAADCGYDPFWSNGTGEGVYVVSGSTQADVGPEQALAGLTYPGSGVRMATPAGYQHVNCAGVAVYRNAAGTAVAWVAVLAQYDDGIDCPEPVAVSAAPSPSPSPSPSPTPSPTATPTPTATPQARFNATLTLVPGQWNLVTLPAGSLAEVLARAAGCYEAVYQLKEGEWRRYSPNVPGYARNLAVSDGGAFWIMASSRNCGTIDL
jgi:hypothetical protein